MATEQRIVKRWKNSCDFAAPHKYFRELILGASDTGKTSYLRKIVEVEGHLYNQIVLIGPHVRDPRWGLTDIIKSTGKVTKIFEDFDDKGVQSQFYEFINKSAAEGLDTLVIVDDPIGITHFVKAGNQHSPWNQLMTGVKQKRVGIKFSTQGDIGLAPICRKQCDRIVRFPDYDNPKRMLSWCAIMSDARDFAQLIEKNTNPHHAIVFCKFRGMKAFFLLRPDMTLSPIESV